MAAEAVDAFQQLSLAEGAAHKKATIVDDVDSCRARDPTVLELA